jgi:hypothetical protein
MPDYKDKSDAELEREQQRLMREIDKLRDAKAKVQDELNSRATKARAEDLMEGLSDEQKDVLVKAVTAAAKQGSG